jgi:hypothetical protein
MFVVVYEILVAMVRLYGPVRTQSFVRSVQRLADVLSSASGQIAKAASPVSFPNVESARVR